MGGERGREEKVLCRDKGGLFLDDLPAVLIDITHSTLAE